MKKYMTKQEREKLIKQVNIDNAKRHDLINQMTELDWRSQGLEGMELMSHSDFIKATQKSKRKKPTVWKFVQKTSGTVKTKKVLDQVKAKDHFNITSCEREGPRALAVG